MDLESVSDGLFENWGNSKVFSSQNQVISKKKKKKKRKVFAKYQSDFSAEIRNSKVFSSQNQVISKKKKKRSSPKFRVIFRPKSKFQRFFPPKIRWSPKKSKKKKGLRQNSEWLFGRNPKFKGFFLPKLGDLQKKKKRSSPKFRIIFLPISQFRHLRGGSFRMGGAIFHFSQKIGLKSTKNMRFCILHKPMEGARAPPAPPWLRYWWSMINPTNIQGVSKWLTPF